jgi:type IV pilus assembly protein PilC
MNFFYEATDSSGQTIMGRLDAASEADVRQHLQRMGYQPQAVAVNPASQTLQAMPAQPAPSSAQPQTTLMVTPAAPRGPRPSDARATMAPTSTRSSGIILAGNAARTMAGVAPAAQRHVASAAPANMSRVGGVNDRDRLFFFQQLASLVKSGMSIYAALDNLAPRTHNKNLAHASHEMADAARNGGRISDVMERYPRIFEDHIVGLVRAGELGGFLEIALSEIALNYEQNLALFKGAWIPKMMATQGLFALALIIPAFQDLIGSMDLDKGFGPGIVRYLQHEAILLPLAFLIIQGIKYGWQHMQLPGLRYKRDSLILRVPPFGDLHRQAALAAFIRMLRRLYHAGIGPVPAWEGATQTASNVVIRERLAAAYDMMQRGTNLPDAFSATGLFTGNIEQLLMTGHLSGQVVESLDQIAEFYQDRVDEAAKKARFGIFRIGCLAMLVLGGITFAWAVKSYFAAIFNFVDKNFSPDMITLFRG